MVDTLEFIIDKWQYHKYFSHVHELPTLKRRSRKYIKILFRILENI